MPVSGKDDLEHQVRLLSDHREIENLLKIYCRAIDRLDVDLLKSIYHPDATDSHGAFEGNAHEFADFIIDNLRTSTSYGFHTVTHAVIDIEGDVAASEAYYMGYHRIPVGREKLTAFFGESYVARAEQEGSLDREHEFECGGRYIDRFERRDGAWKIAKRRITNEWRRSAATTPYWLEGQAGQFDLPGARDRSDPVFANLLGA